MDIYSFINSPDVGEYCRKIGKVWTAFEMAVIISRSERSVKERHAAWRSLISDYPDMPTPKNMHFKSHGSLHKILLEVIAYKEAVIAVFEQCEPGAVYEYNIICNYRENHSDSVFTTLEKALANIKEHWDPGEAPAITMKKLYLDDAGVIDVDIDYDGNIYSASCYGFDDDVRNKRFPDIDFESDSLTMFAGMFYVDIPLPFQLGDVLTIRHNGRLEKDPIFVLEPRRESDEKRYLRYISGKFGDGSDMIDWGNFVSDDGTLYGDHTGSFDNFEYYRGKFEGNDRLLHYVSLFLKGEIRLPELLVMQCRIMLEHQLDDSLDYMNHGVCIPEELLAENHFTPDENTP